MSTEDWISKYKEVKPEEFTTNPFTFYHHQWPLVTAGDENKCNSMTISWGANGTFMSKSAVTVYVRGSRYTKEFMDKFDYFSICVLPDQFKEALRTTFGNKSGRDTDKYKEAGMKTVKIDNTMALEDSTTILVCKKILSGPIDNNSIVDCENKKNYFNPDDPLDYIMMYIGEVEKILVKNA